MLNLYVFSKYLGLILIGLMIGNLSGQQILGNAGELEIKGHGCGGTISCVATARPNLTRWGSDYLPTDIDDYDIITASAACPNPCGFDAPNSWGSLYGENIAWGFYDFEFIAPGFTREFSIDLRDAAWSGGYGGLTDFYLDYYNADPD